MDPESHALALGLSAYTRRETLYGWPDQRAGVFHWPDWDRGAPLAHLNAEYPENPGIFGGNPENPEIKNHNFSGNCAAGITMAPLCPQINACALRSLARGE